MEGRYGKKITNKVQATLLHKNTNTNTKNKQTTWISVSKTQPSHTTHI